MVLTEAAVHAALAAETWASPPDPEVLSYAASVLADADTELGADGQGAYEAVGELLADAAGGDAAARSLCRRLAAALQPAGGGASDAAASHADELLSLRSLLLAYGGRTLLKPTHLTLRRRRRYVLVAANGTGKSTLMQALAAGDAAGYPAELKRIYVAHEALASADCVCDDFLAQGTDASPEERGAALAAAGFSPSLAAARVAQLSGGWRMKLALARATLQKAELLLLDEPTNHLDVASVAALRAQLLALRDCTLVLVSHDPVFCEAVATDVLYFAEQQLTPYDSWASFVAARPDALLADRSPNGGCSPSVESSPLPADAGAGTAASAPSHPHPPLPPLPPPHQNGLGHTHNPVFTHFSFPDPGALDGVKSRNKVVLRAADVTFTHAGAKAPTLRNVRVRVCLASRVAICGANGAGKSTLLKLLVGEIQLDARESAGGGGELSRHHSLRCAFVSQHALHHLEDSLGDTPVAYMQRRFAAGRDAEDLAKSTLKLTEEEEAARKARGGIEAVIGRRQHGKELFYEVRKAGRKNDKDNTWEPLSFLRAMPPYVQKLVLDYDERLKALQGGMEVRPITSVEIKAHLASFGVDEELALSKIRGFSGGQKCRLVLAAAVWNRPHLIALDEPSNFLDVESLDSLQVALRKFPGAVLVVSHNTGFVDAVCTERWRVEGGVVTIEKERGRVED